MIKDKEIPRNVGFVIGLLLLVLLYFTSPFANAQTTIQGFPTSYLLETPTAISTSNTTTALTANSTNTNVQFVGTSPQVVSLPDATSIPTGRSYYITNRTSSQIPIYASSGGLLRTLLAGDQAKVILRYNGTAAGTWDVSLAHILLSDPNQVSGVLPITNGGTNNPSFSSGSVLFYDAGTSKITENNSNLFWDNTLLRLGIGIGASNTAPSAGLDVHNSGTNLIAQFNNTGSQGSSAGALINVAADPGVAMASGSRLGQYAFAGSYDTSHALSNGTAMQSFATENWSSTTKGSKLQFSVTPNTTVGVQTAMIIDQDKTIALPGYSSGFLSTNTSGEVSARQVDLSTNDVQNTLTTGKGGTGTNVSFSSGTIVIASGSGNYASDLPFFRYDYGAKRMFIGKAGISQPQNTLHLDNGTSTAANIQFTAGTTTGQTSSDGFVVGVAANGNAIINQQENNSFRIYTNNTQRALIDNNGNFALQNATAMPLAPSALNGFFYLPYMTGKPTNQPSGINGTMPLVFDGLKNRLYYNSGPSASGWVSPSEVSGGGTGFTTIGIGEVMMGGPSVGNISAISPGDSGTVLTSNGPGSMPTYQTVSATLLAPGEASINAASTIDPSYNVIYANAGGGSFAITVPNNASYPANQTLKIIKTDTTVNVVSTAGSITTHHMYTPGETWTFQNVSSSWSVFQHMGDYAIPPEIVSVGAVSLDPNQGIALGDTVSRYECKRHSGDRLFCNLNIYKPSTGGGNSAGSGDYLIKLPNGISNPNVLIDGTRIVYASGLGSSGTVPNWSGLAVSKCTLTNMTTPDYNAYLAPFDNDHFKVGTPASNAVWRSNVYAFSGGVGLQCVYDIPMTGWEANK